MDQVRFAAGVVSAMIVVLAGTPSGVAQRSGAGAVTLPEMSASLALGKTHYETYCAECHGINAAGTDKGPTFLHSVYHPGHHGDAAFMTAPSLGARAHHWDFGDMKPVAGVTDEQLEQIVAYVRALQQANDIF